MKTRIRLVSGLCVLLTAGCVVISNVSAEPAVPVVQALPVAEAGSLDELVAPIALYPDALVALILPASTVSSDLVLAARYLASGGDRGQFDGQPWDDSVKALAHYPDVVKWMDENLAWTQRLGEAYLDKPEDVMAAIQRDRARARANGVLVDTEQQQIVMEEGNIRIVPAQRDVIYVPRYDPQIVYVERPVYYWGPDPWLTFGIGFGVGAWLAYDCDWRARTIWVDHRRHVRWREIHDWRHPHFPGRPGYVHHPGWDRWKPAPGRIPPPHRRHFDSPRHGIPHPTPIAGAPRVDRHRHHPGPWRPNRDGVHPDRTGRDRPRFDRANDRVAQPAAPRVQRPANPPVPNPATTPAQVAPAPSSGRRWPQVSEQNGERSHRRDNFDQHRNRRGPSEGRPNAVNAPARAQHRPGPATVQRVPAPAAPVMPPPRLHSAPARAIAQQAAPAPRSVDVPAPAQPAPTRSLPAARPERVAERSDNTAEASNRGGSGGSHGRVGYNGRGQGR